MKSKSLTASEMGKRGGPRGGKARMASMTDKQRSELGKLAARARWGKRKSNGN